VVRIGGSQDGAMDYKAFIRTQADWPQPGVRFRDLSPLFSNPHVFQALVHDLAKVTEEVGAMTLAGIDARGFVLAGALSFHRKMPFLMVRKKGKLPPPVQSEAYALEYGEACLEIPADLPDFKGPVMLLDDLIATGGTLMATVNLFDTLGIDVAGVAAVVDLPELGGSQKLKARGIKVFSLCSYDLAE